MRLRKYDSQSQVTVTSITPPIPYPVFCEVVQTVDHSHFSVFERSYLSYLAICFLSLYGVSLPWTGFNYGFISHLSLIRKFTFFSEGKEVSLPLTGFNCGYISHLSLIRKFTFFSEGKGVSLPWTGFNYGYISHLSLIRKFTFFSEGKGVSLPWTGFNYGYISHLS